MPFGWQFCRTFGAFVLRLLYTHGLRHRLLSGAASRLGVGVARWNEWRVMVTTCLTKVSTPVGSGEDALDQFAVDVGEAHVSAAQAEGYLFVVYSQQMQHGGVEVVDLAFVFDGFVAVFVGGAVGRCRP